jgi:pilus assembly protein CpaB
MTRPSAVVVVSVAALVFAGLASWGMYKYLQQETNKSKVSSALLDKAVVAAADLPIGTKLNATQLKVVNWPREGKPQGSFPDISAVTDRVVVRQISTGDIVTEQKLLPKDIKSGAGMMTYAVPEGHRAVTVRVDEVAGVAGFLTPGDHVDIVLTTQVPGRANENISKIVLQNVPILATGQIASEQKDGKPVVVPTVTLDLVPQDAEKLVLANSKGSLQLLLRNFIDKAPIESRGATIIKVLTGMETEAIKGPVNRSPRPAHAKVQGKQPPSPPSPYSVEIIKGASKSSRQFAPEQ